MLQVTENKRKNFSELFLTSGFEIVFGGPAESGCWGAAGQKVALRAVFCNPYHGSAL
jgi:hypothetical protein